MPDIELGNPLCGAAADGSGSAKVSSAKASAAQASASAAACADHVPDPLRGSVAIRPEQRAEWYYALPEDASPLQRACEPLRAFEFFWRRLCGAFGWRYVVLVCSVYGVSQGVGNELKSFGTDRFFPDPPPLGLNLTAAEQAGPQGTTFLPWQIKALYGMASDLWPLFGLHFAPYIVLSGTVGVGAWLGLGLIEPSKLTAVLLLTLGNYATASPDVIVDATVAQRSNTHPTLAADLQSLCWGVFGFGGLLATFVVAPLYQSGAAQALFLATAVTAAAILFPALAGFLPEQREKSEQPQPGRVAVCAPAFRHPLTGPVFKLAVLVCFFSFGLSLLNLMLPDFSYTAHLTLAIAVGVIGPSIYLLLRQVSATLAKVRLHPNSFAICRHAT